MSSAPTPLHSDPLHLIHSASPYYKNPHVQLQREVHQYVSTYISPFCEEWEARGEVPGAVLARHAQLGYTAVAVYPLADGYLDGQRLPANINPAEWDGFHDLIVIDEIARCGEDQGISALTIPLKTKGVACKKMHNSGVSASGSTYIDFDDVQVPVENRVGKENEGFAIIMSNFNHERLWLACTSLRMARVCAEDAFKHAVTRETFEKKLVENQMIRGKISEFGRSIDSAYSWMEQLVFLIEHSKWTGKGLSISGAIASLKVLAGRTLERINREAQQIMVGLGYSRNGRGARIEQISRDARVMVVGGGSEEILIDLSVKQELRDMHQLRKPKEHRL